MREPVTTTSSITGADVASAGGGVCATAASVQASARSAVALLARLLAGDIGEVLLSVARGSRRHSSLVMCVLPPDSRFVVRLPQHARGARAAQDSHSTCRGKSYVTTSLFRVTNEQLRVTSCTGSLFGRRRSAALVRRVVVAGCCAGA